VSASLGSSGDAKDLIFEVVTMEGDVLGTTNIDAESEGKAASSASSSCTIVSL
jgi:hypothetical protein